MADTATRSDTKSSDTIADGSAPRRRGRPREAALDDAILEAARALVEERGYPAATLEAIAARAGVGRPALYRRWRSKAELFVDVYERIAAAGGLTVDTGSLAGDLRRLFGALFETYRTTPAARILGGLIGEAQGDPAVADTLDERIVIGRRALLRRPIVRAIARGELAADSDPDFLVDAIVGIVWRRVLLDRAPLDDDFARRIAALVGASQR